MLTIRLNVMPPLSPCLQLSLQLEVFLSDYLLCLNTPHLHTSNHLHSLCI